MEPSTGGDSNVSTETTVNAQSDADGSGAGCHPWGPGSHAPLDDPNEMPSCYPIKGNTKSMLYHRPDSSSYDATVAGAWFVSPSAAEAAGLRLAGSHPQVVSSAHFEPGQAGHPCTEEQLDRLGLAGLGTVAAENAGAKKVASKADTDTDATKSAKTNRNNTKTDLDGTEKINTQIDASTQPDRATASDTETSPTRGRAKMGRPKSGRPKPAKAKTSTPQTRGESSEGAGSMLPVRFSADPSGGMAELEPVSESVRYILARAGGAPTGNLPARIAVVSALPGEGTTTISRVLSSVLSNDFGVETCRVDLSWASASKRGVLDVLVGAADLDTVLEWEGRAATLHSGPVSQSERHQLARSEELDKLISMLAGRFRHVIFDLPAVLSGSDGLAMMRLADAYLLVVKHGVTTLQQVQIATDQLSDVDLLGSVLNHVRTRTPRPLSRWLAG